MYQSLIALIYGQMGRGWEAGCDSRDNKQRMETAGRVRGNAGKGWWSGANRSEMEEKQSALSGKDSNH